MKSRHIQRPITLAPPLAAPRSLAHILPLDIPVVEEGTQFMGDISNWTAAEIEGAEDRLRALFPEFFSCEKRPAS